MQSSERDCHTNSHIPRHHFARCCDGQADLFYYLAAFLEEMAAYDTATHMYSLAHNLYVASSQSLKVSIPLRLLATVAHACFVPISCTPNVGSGHFLRRHPHPPLPKNSHRGRWLTSRCAGRVC